MHRQHHIRGGIGSHTKAGRLNGVRKRGMKGKFPNKALWSKSRSMRKSGGRK